MASAVQRIVLNKAQSVPQPRQAPASTKQTKTVATVPRAALKPQNVPQAKQIPVPAKQSKSVASVPRDALNKPQNVPQAKQIPVPAKQTKAVASIPRDALNKPQNVPQAKQILTPAQKTTAFTDRVFSVLRICTAISVPVTYLANFAVTRSLTPPISTCLLTLALAAFSTASGKKYTIEAILRVMNQFELREVYSLGGRELVQIMADRGVDLKTKGSLLIHEAVLAGDIPFLRYLIAKRLDVNAPNQFGRTPLHQAVVAENVEAASILLENGANVNALDGDGVPPIMIACCSTSNAPLIQKLLFYKPSLLIGPKKRSIFSYGFLRPKAMRVLLDVQGVEKFKTCRTISDFCDVLYQPSVGQLPPNLKAFVSKLPLPKCFDQLTKERDALCRGIASLDKFIDLFKEQFAKESSLFRKKQHLLNGFLLKRPLHEIIQKLQAANPLFSKMYELAGRPKVEYTSEVLNNGICYDPAKQTIYLSRELIYDPRGNLKVEVSIKDVITKLHQAVLFTLLSDQIKSLHSNLNKMPREVYTACKAWYNAEMFYWWNKACTPMFEVDGKPIYEFSDDRMLNFEMRWKIAGQRSIYETRSSADTTRLEWALNVDPQVIIAKGKAYKNLSHQILPDKNKR